MITLFIIGLLITIIFFILSINTYSYNNGYGWFLGCILVGVVTLGLFAACATNISRTVLEPHIASVTPTTDGTGFFVKCGETVEISYDVRLVGRETVEKVWAHRYNKFDMEYEHSTSYDFSK